MDVKMDDDAMVEYRVLREDYNTCVVECKPDVDSYDGGVAMLVARLTDYGSADGRIQLTRLSTRTDDVGTPERPTHLWLNGGELEAVFYAWTEYKRRRLEQIEQRRRANPDEIPF